MCYSVYFLVTRTSAVNCLESLSSVVTIMCQVGCKALLTQFIAGHSSQSQAIKLLLDPIFSFLVGHFHKNGNYLLQNLAHM